MEYPLFSSADRGTRKRSILFSLPSLFCSLFFYFFLFFYFKTLILKKIQLLIEGRVRSWRGPSPMPELRGSMFYLLTASPITQIFLMIDRHQKYIYSSLPRCEDLYNMSRSKQTASFSMARLPLSWPSNSCKFTMRIQCFPFVHSYFVLSFSRLFICFYMFLFYIYFFVDVGYILFSWMQPLTSYLVGLVRPHDDGLRRPVSAPLSRSLVLPRTTIKLACPLYPLPSLFFFYSSRFFFSLIMRI